MCPRTLEASSVSEECVDLQHYFKVKSLHISHWEVLRNKIAAYQVINQPISSLTQQFIFIERYFSSVSTSRLYCHIGVPQQFWGQSISWIAVESCVLLHSASFTCLTAASRSRRAQPWRACRSPALCRRTQRNPWRPPRARRAHRLCRLYWRWNRSEFCGTDFASASDAVWKVSPCVSTHVRTIDEQQQQAKPLTSVSDQSAVATAATYVDSPRKVSAAPPRVPSRCLGSLQSHRVTFDLPSLSSGWRCCFGVGSSLGFSLFLLPFVLLPLVVVSLSFRALILGWSSSALLTGRCLYFGFYT